MARSDLRRMVAALVHLVAATAFAPMISAPPALSAPATVGGPFTLVATDGTVVTDQTYRGKWLLVFFGFTFCPNTCPTTLLEIAKTLEGLGSDADELQPLFITVDPQRDTPEVIASYVGSFDPRIVGLSGSPEQVAAVARDYGVYYAPHRFGSGPDDYVLDHTSYLYLMAPDGRFVRAFDGETPGHRLSDAIRETWRKQTTAARP